MSASGQDEPRQQTFHGPGSFGGDNKGIINNVLLDAKSKALLAKMAKYAPPLAGLLEKAIRDGVMSPDAVEVLMFAARNINEDVADALLIAGRNINEDVAADLMMAGRNINEDVANRFILVKNDLNETVSELDRVVDSLRKTVGQVSNLQGRSIPDRQLGPAGTVTGTARRTTGVDIRPSPRSAGKWRFIGTWICCSALAGLVTAVILMRSHHGGWAVAVGIVLLGVAVLLQFASASTRPGGLGRRRGPD